ncbi:BTB/POZ domain-containing protein [Drosera capensis]
MTTSPPPRHRSRVDLPRISRLPLHTPAQKSPPRRRLRSRPRRRRGAAQLPPRVRRQRQRSGPLGFRGAVLRLPRWTPRCCEDVAGIRRDLRGAYVRGGSVSLSGAEFEGAEAVEGVRGEAASARGFAGGFEGGVFGGFYWEDQLAWINVGDEYVIDVPTYIGLARASRYPQVDRICHRIITMAICGDFGQVGSSPNHFPSDIIFYFQGRPIEAHRVILSARSAFFKMKFETEWMDRAEVRFSKEKLSYLALYSLIHFFYSDRLEISVDDMEDLDMDNRHVEDLADICVNVDGTVFRCHQVVLASRSDYFKTRMLCMKDFLNGTDDSSCLPCIEENDLSKEAFEKMIEYMYTDALRDIDPEQVEEMFDAASRYFLLPLKRAVADALLPHLEMASPAEVCHWLLLADMYDVVKIREYCLDIIAWNFEAFSDTREFRAMLLTLPRRALWGFIPLHNRPKCTRNRRGLRSG